MSQGHQVVVETGAGLGERHRRRGLHKGRSHRPSHCRRSLEHVGHDYEGQGPLPPEYPKMKKGLLLFTYLHLAAEPDFNQSPHGTGSGCCCLRDSGGSFEGASLAYSHERDRRAYVGPSRAHFLEKRHGGRGVLLGGVPGVTPGEVVIIGGGVSRHKRRQDGSWPARQSDYP